MAYSLQNGFTTTDFSPARLNELVLEHSEGKYVLMDSSKLFLPSTVSYSRRVSPDKILTEAYPDRTYPETDNLNIDILSFEK